MAGRPTDLNPFFSETTSLKGVGPRVAEALGRAMGTRLKDLLLTPPSSLIDRSNRPKISDAKTDEICTFHVTVGQHIVPSNRNRPYRVRVFDETGDMTLTFFKARADYLNRVLPEGSQRIVSGKTEVFNAQLQMTHPDYILHPDKIDELRLYETLYPLSAGLSQKVAGKAMMGALQRLPTLPEWLDKDMLSKQDWPSFHEAIIRIHQPEHPIDIKIDAPPRLRLAYDELLAKQLAIAIVRENTRRSKGRALQASGQYVDDVLKGAPFKPTNAQNQAFAEISADMTSPYRMARLLQGDVGAGKTFVAALACAQAAEAGVQTALMAPTEILARQHAQTLKSLLAPAGLTVEAVTGRDKGNSRDALATGLAEGYIDVVVGTHALFQEKVEFKDLGLVIIDEQHRFGVHDRLKLTEKGHNPDLLVICLLYTSPSPRD